MITMGIIIGLCTPNGFVESVVRPIIMKILAVILIGLLEGISFDFEGMKIGTTAESGAFLITKVDSIQMEFDRLATQAINFHDKWETLSSLGRGSTCEVFLVQEHESKRRSAIKLFDSMIYRSRALSEAQIELSLQHPRILKVLRYLPNLFLSDKSAKSATSNDARHLPALELEYAQNGHLLGLIKTLGSLSATAARTYFHQLIDALEYIHGHGICHLDIKPENILLDEDFGIKIADFGASKKLNCSEKFLLPFGTLPYLAPEIHEHEPYDGFQADLFAAGIILFMMRSGTFPFVAATREDMLYNNIANGDHERFWEMRKEIDEDENVEYEPDFQDLINKMFEFDPQKRLTLKQIKHHSWYRAPILSQDKLASYIRDALSRK